jgi:prepilin peptidase CpaA
MPTAPDPYIAATATLFVAACCVFDVRTRQIPNELSGLAVLTGIAANLWLSGATGFTQSAVGMALPLVLLVPPFLLGGLGGGDVKMMAAVGAIVGPDLVLESLVLGTIAGGLVAVYRATRLRRASATFSSLARMTRGALAERSLTPLRVSQDSPEAITLPYSVPLALGTLASLSLAYAHV